MYEGEWIDGKPHGQGIKTWPDGRKYDGMWNMGKPIGRGRKIYPDGRAKEGNWEDGKFIEGADVAGQSVNNRSTMNNRSQIVIFNC